MVVVRLNCVGGAFWGPRKIQPWGVKDRGLSTARCRCFCGNQLLEGNIGETLPSENWQFFYFGRLGGSTRMRKCRWISTTFLNLWHLLYKQAMTRQHKTYRCTLLYKYTNRQVAGKFINYHYKHSTYWFLLLNTRMSIVNGLFLDRKLH